MSDKPHVVVLGAGFGGVNAAEKLAKDGCRVTLIDHRPYNTFQPLLYQVATGGLNPGDITYSLRAFIARFDGLVGYRRTSVTDLDQDAQEIICDDGKRISYDYLIIAIGVKVNHFGIPGAAEYSMSMYTRADALQVRDTIFGGIERIAGSAEHGTGTFTTVVVGGGATGVEMAGTLAELRDFALPKAYPEMDPDRSHVVLVEMAPHLLMPFDQTLRDYTYRQLQKRHVDIRLETAISKVEPDRVEFDDGTTLEDVDLVIWAAGISGADRLKRWNLPLGKGGRIEVDSDLRVKGTERIFAVGDTAVDPDNPLPQLAQPAIQGGTHAARQILRLTAGAETVPFAYIDKGTMATIGNRAAVAELFKGAVKLRGTIAWLLWIAVHLFSLLGGRNRIQTMLNLTFRYITYPLRRTGVIVGDVHDTPAQKAAEPDQSSRDRQNR